MVENGKPAHERCSIITSQLALGIRQPWGELILRGIKTLEIRTLPTNVRGTIYLYAGKTLADNKFAAAACLKHHVKLSKLMIQGIIGTVDIKDCRIATSHDEEASCVTWDYLRGKYAWELENPVIFDTKLTPTYLPYGMWFYPFQRKNLI